MNLNICINGALIGNGHSVKNVIISEGIKISISATACVTEGCADLIDPGHLGLKAPRCSRFPFQGAGIYMLEQMRRH